MSNIPSYPPISPEDQLAFAHQQQQQQQLAMSYATSSAPQAYPYGQQNQYYGQSGYPLNGQDATARSMQYPGQASASHAYPYAQGPPSQSGYPVQTPFTVPSNAPAPPSYPGAAPQHYRHAPNPPSSPSPTSSSQSTERYPCPHCSKSFTRNFDRKRHMEIHTPGSSGNNRCLYCKKEYSRADSLKRHIDNGCEMKPTR